jgi:hypothetical protein
LQASAYLQRINDEKGTAGDAKSLACARDQVYLMALLDHPTVSSAEGVARDPTSTLALKFELRAFCAA